MSENIRNFAGFGLFRYPQQGRMGAGSDAIVLGIQDTRWRTQGARHGR